jgi:two-component system, chemotaxis family, response regulator PixG
MVCNHEKLELLYTQLSSLIQEQATGKLVLASPRDRWFIYFLKGQILFVISDRHRVRRWSRALEQHCQPFKFNAERFANSKLWEYQLLHHGVVQGQLSLQQAKSALSAILGEIFFQIAGCKDLKSQWQPSRKQPNATGTFNLPLSFSEIQTILQQSVQLRQQWHELGLSYLCPDRAPFWKTSSTWQNRLSSNNTVQLKQLFNGQNTLWDIALGQKRSILEVTRTLHHFIQQGELGIKSVVDFPSPLEQLKMARSAIAANVQTIACIDDSVTSSWKLREILNPHGYQVFGIQDPLKELPILVQQQPALIFLDLVMPQVYGSDFCAFLRKTTVFKDTPIVILTSSDGAIDRVRANLNGASDFLSKPPTPEKVLKIVRKHLSPTQPETISMSSLSLSPVPTIS